MKIGDQVLYKGMLFWVISVWEDGADDALDHVEIAPTRHGAGSFMTTREYLQEADA